MKLLQIGTDDYINSAYIAELYVDSQYATYGDVSQIEYRIMIKMCGGDVKKMQKKYLSRQQADDDLQMIIKKL